MKAKNLFGTFLLIALLLSACGGDGTASLPVLTTGGDGNGEEEPVNTLSVSGRGTVTLSPNQASVSIGVQTESENAAEAVNNNSSQVDAVMDALRGFNIAEEDVKTTNFSVSPRQERDPNTGEVIATVFRVQNTVNVKVRELDNLGEILDAVVAAGANTISGIRFEVDPETRQVASEQALEAAMEDAERQAEILARQAGVRIVDVKSLNINTFGGIVEQFETPALAREEGVGGGEVPVSPGETEVVVEVHVVYVIEMTQAAPAESSEEE